MLSATSHIGLEFLTKFLNMSQLQNRLILLYQSLPLQSLFACPASNLIDFVVYTNKHSGGDATVYFLKYPPLTVAIIRSVATYNQMVILKLSIECHLRKCIKAKDRHSKHKFAACLNTVKHISTSLNKTATINFSSCTFSYAINQYIFLCLQPGDKRLNRSQKVDYGNVDLT